MRTLLLQIFGGPFAPIGSVSFVFSSLLAVLVVVACGLAGVGESAQAQSTTTRHEVTANGARFSVRLSSYPEHIQKDMLSGAGIVADLFTAGPDSVFWCGPNRPHPFSWLSPSVICMAPLSFQLEIRSASDDSTEVLDFDDVGPGFYSIVAISNNQEPVGECVVRYRYEGDVFCERTINVRREKLE